MGRSTVKINRDLASLRLQGIGNNDMRVRRLLFEKTGNEAFLSLANEGVLITNSLGGSTKITQQQLDKSKRKTQRGPTLQTQRLRRAAAVPQSIKNVVQGTTEKVVELKKLAQARSLQAALRTRAKATTLFGNNVWKKQTTLKQSVKAGLAGAATLGLLASAPFIARTIGKGLIKSVLTKGLNKSKKTKSSMISKSALLKLGGAALGAFGIEQIAERIGVRGGAGFIGSRRSGKRRRTGLLNKNAKKAIRRYKSLKKQITKAASDMGFTLKRRGGSRASSKGTITAVEAIKALSR